MAQARLGSYELGALVGRGGMGQVHAARCPAGRNVVVKRLRNTLALDVEMRERLGHEGRVSRRVSHPNVVRVFEHGTASDGSPFIVMDHARGTTLRELIDQVGPLPVARIRVLALQLLGGLAAIHAAGVIHADIKTCNVIVDTIDATDHVTIIDFGLARTSSSPAMRDDDDFVAGTPEFMAPELFRGGPPTVASDVFAAAIVIYEMLAGETPFCGEPPMQILHRQMTEAVTFRPRTRAMMSAGLEQVLVRALDRDPRQRYQSVRELAAAFDAATRGLGSEAAAIARRAPPVTVFDLEPLALADQPRESPALQRWRRELLEAIGQPSPDPMIVAYLGLADALINAGRMTDAVQELEGAIVLLLPSTGAPPRPLWRITVLLAAMHDRLGNRVRARRCAIDAHDHATRAGDVDGVARSRDLLHRLCAGRGTMRTEHPTMRVKK